MNVESTQVSAAPSNLTLFCVMLPWNPNNLEEGTYENSVWAVNTTEAERLIAEEMANSYYHGSADVESGDAETVAEDAAQFSQDLIDSGMSVVTDVVGQVESKARQLLSGPSGDLAGHALEDFNVIMAILAKYKGT